MVKTTTPYHIDRDDIHVILDHVQAWVCSQCGEVLFEEQEVQEIQKLARVVEEQAGKLRTSA
jgi:YgiT-type zinc finger domain-containing protein